MAVAEDAVFNEDVCRVCLGGDTVIPVLYIPSPKDDVVGEESVGSIGVACRFRVCAFGFYIDVFEDYVFGADDCYGPVMRLLDGERTGQGTQIAKRSL